MLLVLDTCLGACSAALYDQRVIAERHALMERGHAEALPPMVQDLLRSAGLKASDLTRVAVTIGPGSFTGVRIGLSFARGLALARNIPLIGIDTLRATAAPLLGDAAPVVVAHHAGASGLVYTARFGDGVPRLCALEAVGVRDGDIFVGTASSAQRPAYDLPLAHLFASHAARLPASKTPPEPIYLREADAKPQQGTARDIEGLAIRTSSDTALLAAIHAQSFDHPWTEQSIAEMLSATGTQALVAETALGPQGFAILRAIADEAELLTIATLPHMRQRGVGRTLLNAATQLLSKHNTKLLHLEVASDNYAALALYKKLGFTKSGLRKAYYAREDSAVDAILMQKKLAS